MRNTRTSFAELEAFASVARCGGFRSAARELDVSSSAISHAVGTLEDRLGLRLFNRTTRSVVLTAAGEQLLTKLLPALSEIETAIESAGEELAEPRGELRLNMALGAARFMLEPVLLDYLNRYSAMTVEITTEAALVDVVGLGFDAGIRPRELVPPDMIAIPILNNMKQVIVGSPRYLRRRGIPKNPADLKGHDCICARMPGGRLYRWEFQEKGKLVEIEVSGRLVLDDSGLMLNASLADAGLAYVSERSASKYLQDGQLEILLQDWMPSRSDLCLYYPGHRHVPRKLRAFIDVAREHFRESRAGNNTGGIVNQ